MTRTPCSHDDRVGLQSSGSIVPEAEHRAGTHLPAPPTPRLVVHTHNRSQPSASPFVPRHDEIYPSPQFTHPSYLFPPMGAEHSDGTPPNYGNLGLAQPLKIHHPWGLSYPSPGTPPDTTFEISPPTLHHLTAGSSLCPDVHGYQSPWSIANAQVNSVDEHVSAPIYDLPPTFPPHDAGPSLDPLLFYSSEPYSETLDVPALYPCLWTEGGNTCGVMVQATRSYMNRHLHAYHGFSGPDNQQMGCHWDGCGETMQQGSIARHMVTCHLQAKVTCPMCFKKLSRQDVIPKHQRVCPVASAWR